MTISDEEFAADKASYSNVREQLQREYHPLVRLQPDNIDRLADLLFCKMGKYFTEIERLRAENAEMKAEVERLRAEMVTNIVNREARWLQDIVKLQAENAKKNQA